MSDDRRVTRAVGIDPSRSSRRRPLTGAIGPVVAILLLAPFLGEVLSTAKPPLDFVLPWNLVLLAGLYGCGALLVREVTHRYQFSTVAMGVLAAGYAVYEEALIVRSWYDPRYQESVGLGAYSRIWDTNLLLAVHLTAFHVAVSVLASILIVERIFPERRGAAWLGRRGVAGAAATLLVGVPVAAAFLLGYGDPGPVPVGPVAAAAGLCVLLVVCAFQLPRRRGEPYAPGPRPSPRFVGPVVFGCTAAHFFLTYAIPTVGVPWPIGIAIASAPIALGFILVRAMGARAGLDWPDGVPVVTGILSFFVVLDALVGLGGRYDLTLSALLTGFGLWWLNRFNRPSIPMHDRI